MSSLVTDTPPFETIAIAGLGLIGGSIALGVRERWSACRILGIDRPAVQGHALSSGAIDRALPAIADASEADLIILGTHGYGTFGRALLGSVASAVVRTIPFPILLVPPPARDESQPG